VISDFNTDELSVQLGRSDAAMAFEASSALLSTSAVTKRLQDRGPHFQLVSSSEFPRFVLRPPTIDESYTTPSFKASDELNRAVHLEWQKGMGSAWMLGAPSIDFVPESSTFQLNPSSVSESGLEAALDTIEHALLDECLSRHLAEGGDDRLHIHPETGVNKYYCPPRPVKDVIIRSSCTCSPPSPDSFDSARILLRRLWQGRVSFQHAFDETRSEISRLLGIHTPHEVILHPSGSDAELIPLAVAALRANALGCSRIVNIVVAAGEVGSGTAPAAGGLHFSKFAPCGTIVDCGGIVSDFPNSTKVVEIKPRLSNGFVVPEYDALVLDAVVTAERDEEKPFLIVHAVDGSKTGLRVPSRGCLETVQRRLGNRCLIVMDACQCRSEAAEIEWFMERGAIVLVTSSKFYGAPGFCGAVLVPEDAAEELANMTTPPVGLNDYLTKLEVPMSLAGLHSALPDGPKNIGLLLRWACGITEMELFSQQGRLVKDVMHAWVYAVRDIVRSREPKLGLIDEDGDDPIRDATRYGGVNSVVSVKFLTSCGTKHLDVAVLRRIHCLLTEDSSAQLPSFASDAERAIAAQKCFVGQPVQLGKHGVLRLAIGAHLAREIAVTKSGLAKALADDARVLDKMMVLSKYCEDML
jgi:hypothetical protein